jgi:hypothetical protein
VVGSCCASRPLHFSSEVVWHQYSYSFADHIDSRSALSLEMDQILKARKMGSASARRRRIQEREIAMQQDEERRTKILLYGYSSEEDDISDEEGNTYSPIPDTQPDQLQPTSRLSTVSTQTAKRNPKSPSDRSQASSFPFPSTVPPKLYIPELVIPQFLPPDFNTHVSQLIQPRDDAETETLFTELDTPIEIATPISYSIPRVRPSMISIKITSPTNSNASHRPFSMPQPPPVPRRSERRVSGLSVRSANYPVELPITSLPLMSETVSDSGITVEKDVIRRRPVTMSVRGEPAVQTQFRSYDVFPRKARMTSSCRMEGPLILEEPQKTPRNIPRIAINAKRTSSFPPISNDPQSAYSVSSPVDLHSKKPTPTLRQRRSSIGLALRNASAPFRSKHLNGRPTTSSSSGSTDSKEGIDISAFPMPPPSPLLQQSFHQEIKSSGSSSELSRFRRVRTTIGL